MLSGRGLCDGPILAQVCDQVQRKPYTPTTSRKILGSVRKTLSYKLHVYFKTHIAPFASKDSVVGVVTKVRARAPGITVRFPTRNKRFISSPKLSDRLWAHTAAYTKGTWALSARDKAVQTFTDHSHLSTGEIKKEQWCTSNLPDVCLA